MKKITSFWRHFLSSIAAASGTLGGLLPLSLLFTSLVAFPPAQGQVWWEDDFSQFDQNRYFVRGNRTYWDQNGRYFVLTPPENSLAGRIYHRERVFTGVFEAQFDIRIGGGTGADGMTIAWVTDYNYQPASGGAHDFAVENGYAVEFDCYNNAGVDPNGQHIAILRNNWQNHLAAWQADEGVIENNQWHRVRVTNEMGYVQVWFDNQRVLEHRIRDYQAFEGYLGFTAGTGGATNWHIVDNIRITIGGPELVLSRDQLEFGPIDRNRQRVLELVISNRAQGEENWKRLQFAITDSGQGPDWLSADPSQGTVPPGDSVVVRVTARPEGADVGEYSRRLYIRSNDPHRQVVWLPAHLWVVDGVGRLRGRISRADNGEPIPEARVSDDRFGIADTTDEEGRYDLGELGSFRYRLRIVKRDYLPRIEEVEVPGGEEVEANFVLYHSLLEPHPARVMVSVPVNEEFRTAITLRNRGNGPLTWTAQLRFPEGGEVEPYRLRFYLPIADSVGDNRLVGIEFVEGHFFVAGGNNGAGRGNIYVFDSQGRYVRRFPQFMNSAWGMRDLAWDGEHLWGGDGNILFAFTTDGDSVRSIRSPINPSRAIAWDPTRELLWTCDLLSDIVGLDREGEERARIRRLGVRIYGLAWYPFDPDGFNLYAYTSDDQHPNGLHRINPVTEQIQFLADLPVEREGRAGGFAITNQWDPYAWTMVGVVQGLPDALAVWQLAPRTDWVRIDPVEGVIEPGGEVEQSLIFNTHHLPVEQQFEATIVYLHDGVGQRREVPILLTVTGAGGLSQRWLSLSLGWNLVSVNVQPPDTLSFAQLVEPLRQMGALILAKDHRGNFYYPARGFNQIEVWDGRRGYWVKTASSAEFSLSGEAIAFEEAIPLEAGWNLVSYLPRVSLPPQVALSGLGDNLLVVKDGWGNFYLPSRNYSNIGLMREGRGYMVKVREAGELIYHLGGIQVASVGEGVSVYEREGVPRVEPTGVNMSLLLVGLPVPEGFVKVWAGERLVGTGIVKKGTCGLAVWGDDPTTPSGDGAFADEELRVSLHTDRAVEELLLPDPLYFAPDEVVVVELKGGDHLTPTQFGILSLFPLPFNSRLEVSFSLPEAGLVSMGLYDLMGRQVATLIEGHRPAGVYRVSWGGENLPSGVYVLRLEGVNRRDYRKVILMR